MALNDFSQAANAAPRNLMIQAQHIKSKLTPKVDKQPVKIVVPEMNIEAIPTAMRRMGWTVAAALMERWFASPEWTMPPSWKDSTLGPGPGPATDVDSRCVDDEIVTMKWALCFRRCNKIVAQLRHKIDNEAAVLLLNKRLTQATWDQRSNIGLGWADMTAREIDQVCQVNATKMGSSLDPLDDMYGALGIATVKVGLIGEAMLDPVTGRRVFHATRAGFYIRDQYDFNGEQFLGAWTENGVLSKLQMIANSFSDSYVYQWHGEAIGMVFNHHFERFRRNNNRGGDFLIYSDVHWIDIDLPIELGRSP